NKLIRSLSPTGGAPVISISTPDENAFFNISDIVTQGTVTFSAGVKAFKINDLDTMLSQSTTDPNSFSFNKTLTLMDGSHSINFFAKDKLLRSSTVTRTVTVDTLPPEINANLTLTTDQKISVSAIINGTGTNIENISINDAVTEFTPAAIVEVTTITDSTPIKISAKDKAGNEITQEFNLLDNIPPTITLKAPKDSFYYNNRKIMVIATIEDDIGIKKIFVDNEEIEINNEIEDFKKFDFIKDKIFETDGKFDIKITALDTTNNTTEKQVSISIDTVNPILELETTQESDGSYTVKGIADGTGSNVAIIKINEEALEFTPAQSITFEKTNVSTLPIQISITDDAGNEIKKEISAKKLDTTPPIITITSPQNGVVIQGPNPTITVTYTVEDDAGIKLVTFNGRPSNSIPSSLFTREKIFRKINLPWKQQTQDNNQKITIKYLVGSQYSESIFLFAGENQIAIEATDINDNKSTEILRATYIPPPPKKGGGAGGGGGGGGAAGGGSVITLPPIITNPNEAIIEGLGEAISEDEEFPDTIEVANPPFIKEGAKADIALIPDIEGLAFERLANNLIPIPQGCSFATVVTTDETIEVDDKDVGRKFATIFSDSTGRAFFAGFAFFSTDKASLLEDKQPSFIDKNGTTLSLVTTVVVPIEAAEGEGKITVLNNEFPLVTASLFVTKELEVSTKTHIVEKPQITKVKAFIIKKNNKNIKLNLLLKAKNILRNFAIINDEPTNLRAKSDPFTSFSFVPDEGLNIKRFTLKKGLKVISEVESDIKPGIKLFNIITPKCADIGALLIPEDIKSGKIEVSNDPERLLLIEIFGRKIED
ncbi:MAG: hypothetical protein HYZ79_02390, partial [Candidatus Melainabacteria bacterium]|nr:hypothetical protein [Candidatus Melainabacteria bacterium]